MAGYKCTLSLSKIKVRISETKFLSFYKPLCQPFHSEIFPKTPVTISAPGNGAGEWGGSEPELTRRKLFKAPLQDNRKFPSVFVNLQH